MSTLKIHQIDLIITTFYWDKIRNRSKNDRTTFKIIVKFLNFGLALCLRAAAIFIVVCSALKAVWRFLRFKLIFIIFWHDSTHHRLCRTAGTFFWDKPPPPPPLRIIFEELMSQSNPCRWNNCCHPDPCSPWGSTPRSQWGTWTTSSTVLHGK